MASAKFARDHDGFVLVFSKTFGEHTLSIRESPDGDEIICEPPLPEDKVKAPANKSLLWVLKDTNLEVRQFIHYQLVSSQEDKDRFIYCVVSIDEEPAMEWADRRGIDLEIDEREAISEGRNIGLSLAVVTQLPEDAESTVVKKGATFDRIPLDTWDKMHLPYDKHCPFQNIYQRHGDQQELLENRMQLRILYQILTADSELGGAELLIDKYLAASYHPLTSFFALQCPDENVPRLTKEEIYGCSSLCSFWTSKLDDIRAYYGEEIGFYFAFLSHYAKSLMPFAAFGVIWFLVQIFTGKIAVNPIVDLIVILMGIVWATYMGEMWYRKEWFLRYQWGMLRLEELAMPRPEFEGVMELSTIDGEIVENYPSYVAYNCKILFSLSTVVFCILVVISSVIGIYIVKAMHPTQVFWSVLVGLINSVQIQIMNYFYIWIAVTLNSWEDHRLQSDYDNYLAVKKIVFYCVNSFNSLFYSAFVAPLMCKPGVNGAVCSNTAVLRTLRIQLATLFFGVIVTTNIFQLAYPPLMIKIKEGMYDRSHASSESNERLLNDDATVDPTLRIGIEEAKQDENAGAENAGQSKKITAQTLADCETQSELQPMTPILDQMAEIIIPHGYIMLFITVFPLMPLLGMLSTMVQMRVDLFNIIHSQRPLPRAAAGIGVWKAVMSAFSVLAVFTNMAILCFRSPGVSTLVSSNPVHLYIFYFVGCIVLSAVLFGIRVLIPDVPQVVADAMERQDYCEKFLIVGAVKDDMTRLKQEAAARGGN